MNPWAIGALAWLAAVIAIAAFLRWTGKRRGHGDQLATRTPAPARPRVPEPGPGAGGTSPSPPAPGPADHLTLGRRKVTIRVYERGICIWDATGTHVGTVETRTRDWDGWLRKLTP